MLDLVHVAGQINFSALHFLEQTNTFGYERRGHRQHRDND